MENDQKEHSVKYKCIVEDVGEFEQDELTETITLFIPLPGGVIDEFEQLGHRRIYQLVNMIDDTTAVYEFRRVWNKINKGSKT